MKKTTTVKAKTTKAPAKKKTKPSTKPQTTSTAKSNTQTAVKKSSPKQAPQPASKVKASQDLRKTSSAKRANANSTQPTPLANPASKPTKKTAAATSTPAKKTKPAKQEVISTQNPNRIQLSLDIEQTFQQAFALHQANQIDAAKSLYEAILNIDPKHVNTLHFLGVLARQAGQYEKAVELIKAALALDEAQAVAHCNLGYSYHYLNQFEAALQHYDRALELVPQFAQAHNNKALTLQSMGRLADALKSAQAALQIQPQYPQAWFNLSNILRQANQLEKALEGYNATLQFAPNFIAALCQRGSLLRILQKPAAGLADYNRALELSPNHLQSLNNRANALRDLDRAEEALVDYEKALQQSPQSPDIWGNLAGAYQELHRFDDAIATYRKALRLAPDDVQLKWDLSLCYLLMGEFKKAWPLYENRWHQTGAFTAPHLRFSAPLWLGKENLNGKTILLHAEQGLGDTIQFCRYANEVADLGATVFLEVQAPLKHLMQSLSGVQAVFAREETLPSFDYQCPLMSLPLALQITTPKLIPSRIPYLSAHQADIGAWQTHLAPSTSRKKMGLAWAGSATHKNDLRRSIPLAVLANTLRSFSTQFQWVSLQKDLRTGDKDTLLAWPELQDVEALLTDFAQTAACIAQLDLIITVDTAIAHLASAMGKPVYLLIPFHPDWRWLLNRDDSPWYPNLTLIRQSKAGEWDAPVAQLVQHLNTLSS